MDKYNSKILEYKNKDIYVVFYMNRNKCYFSRESIKLLKKQNKNFKAYKIIRHPEDKLPKLLHALNNYKDVNGFNPNHKTLPIIFHKGKFIGGYTELTKKIK